ADGAWSAPQSWQDGVPVGTAITARFGPAISAPRTVTLDMPAMVGQVVFDSPVRYTLAGSNPLIIDGGAVAGSINVLNGNHTIDAPLALATATSISIAPGSMLTLGHNVLGPGAALNISGGGR